MSILSVLLALLLAAVSSVSNLWIEGGRALQTRERARASLELMTRELAGSVVDTRTAFIVAPGAILRKCGAPGVPAESHAVLAMAPVGKNGALRCLGYYLQRNEARGLCRLKRILIREDDPNGFFPGVNDVPRETGGSGGALKTDPTDASWFTSNWDRRTFDDASLQAEEAVVSTVADGVVALWVQCLDLLGNPIPLVSESKVHPRSGLIFNSAAYFQMATTTPFESGASFVYLRKTPYVMKANRLPAALEIRIVTVGDEILARGIRIPPQRNLTTADGALDLEKSVAAFLADLDLAGARGATVHANRLRLVPGS